MGGQRHQARLEQEDGKVSGEKLTEWYPPEIKPVHVGYYQRRYVFGLLYKEWWTGQKWTSSTTDTTPCTCQHLPWRGLAEKP